MIQTMPRDDDDPDDEHFEEEDDLDPEGPDSEDLADGDEPATLPCPECRALIHEDAEWCHRCGAYLTREEAMLSRTFWIVLTSLALLGVFAWVYVSVFR